MTQDQLRYKIEMEAARKEADEVNAAAAKRAAAEAVERQLTEKKNRRKIVSQKGLAVANFIQQLARNSDVDRPGQRESQRELLELYPKASRISLSLYNEIEQPTVSGILEEDWAEMKAMYDRVTQITGIGIMMEGEPLDMRNPWDEPPTER